MNTLRQLKRSVLSMILLCLGCAVLHCMVMGQHTNMLHVFSAGNIQFFAGLETVRSPANSWAPGEQPLAVDFEKLTIAAKQHLVRRHGKSIASSSLRALDIRPFYFRNPATENERRRPGEKQRPAWYLVFQFSDVLADGRRLDLDECKVAMMLDGTILEMVKRTEQVAPK